MPLSSGIKHQQLFESIIDDDDTMTANHSQASSSHIPIDSATMLLSVFWNASRDLVHNHHQRIAHTMEFLEEQWKIFAHSQWANHWLPEVRYLQGWTLGEIGILVAIFALTSSYYTIRNDRHRRESKQKQKEEHLKEKQMSKTNAKKKSESSRESSSSWLSHPSLDHLPSLPTLDVKALRFSTGTSWERRRQTLAMFSCSLAFVMPATILCWTTVVHFGIFLPFHVFCLRDVDASGNDSVIPVLYQFRTAVYALGVWGYMIFATVLDDSPTRGSRIPYVRHALGNWWNYACDFLPVVLVKTADLPATRKEKDGDGKIVDLPCKYILGYHPHGIIAVGAFCAFATDGARVLDLSDSGNENDQNIRQPGLPLRPSSFSLLDDDDDDAANNDSSNLSSTTAATAPLIRRGFSSLFPSLERRIVTLPVNFGTPFLREYLMAMGAVTSEKKTFRQYLNSNATVDPDTTGKAMVVVVGGAAESMLAYEGHTQLVLKHRRGFVREAILANASLVPVLGFGETNLYTLYDDLEDIAHENNSTSSNISPLSIASSLFSSFQKFARETFGVAVPIFAGRSVFFKSLGVMPRRRPVVVVVGKPIPPPTCEELGGCKMTEFSPKIDRATDQPLNEHGKVLIKWHAKYVHALEELYHDYKDAPWNSPGNKREQSLCIVR